MRKAWAVANVGMTAVFGLRIHGTYAVQVKGSALTSARFSTGERHLATNSS